MEEQTNLEVNNQAVDALRESAKWSMFLAVIGFIGLGFMIIAALFIGSAMKMIPKDPNNPVSLVQGYISIIYIIIAALYFPPIYYLYKYASDMKTSLQSRNSQSLSEALVSLKSHHKYLGISIIVLMALYVIGIIVMIGFFTSKIAG